MKPIKLGFVRADTHAYYYGIMLHECDSKKLQQYNYVVHHYATGIYDPVKITVPQVDGFEIAAIYDRDEKAARLFSDTFKGAPAVCTSLEDMADNVDAVFVADCDLHGADHLELSQPFLAKGLPTFVDKPFASKLADAQQIARLASDNNAPMFNASILSYVPAAAQFRARFNEIATTYYPVPDEQPDEPVVRLGLVKGVGGAFSQELAGKGVDGGLESRMAYIIHGVALALHLFDGPVEWVEAMGMLPLENLRLHLASGADVVILNTPGEVFPETCSFYASAYSKYGAVHSGPIGDPQFLGGAAIILEKFRDMVRTGTPPVEYDEFVHHIAVIEAADRAQQKGERVYIKELME